MRIIGGTMRGTKLFTLEGLNTRPTLDRVKESLFNILNFDLKDSTVLDLFAGSGALALESVSRGATKVFLCDKSKEAIKIIEKNIEKTKAESKVHLLNMDYCDALNKLKNDKQKFNIIFLDPPYESLFAEDAIEKIEKYGLLEDDGKVIIETDNTEKVLKNIDSKLDSLELKDTRKYGRVSLLFFSSR